MRAQWVMSSIESVVQYGPFEIRIRGYLQVDLFLRRSVMQLRTTLKLAVPLIIACAYVLGAHAQSISPLGIGQVTTCDAAGIGSAHLVSDLPTFAFTIPPNDTSVTFTATPTTG